MTHLSLIHYFINHSLKPFGRGRLHLGPSSWPGNRWIHLCYSNSCIDSKPQRYAVCQLETWFRCKTKQILPQLGERLLYTQVPALRWRRSMCGLAFSIGFSMTITVLLFELFCYGAEWWWFYGAESAMLRLKNVCLLTRALRSLSSWNGLVSLTYALNRQSGHRVMLNIV